MLSKSALDMDGLPGRKFIAKACETEMFNEKGWGKGTDLLLIVTGDV